MAPSTFTNQSVHELAPRGQRPSNTPALKLKEHRSRVLRGCLAATARFRFEGAACGRPRTRRRCTRRRRWRPPRPQNSSSLTHDVCHAGQDMPAVGLHVPRRMATRQLACPAPGGTAWIEQRSGWINPDPWEERGRAGTGCGGVHSRAGGAVRQSAAAKCGSRQRSIDAATDGTSAVGWRGSQSAATPGVDLRQ